MNKETKEILKIEEGIYKLAEYEKNDRIRELQKKYNIL